MATARTLPPYNSSVAANRDEVVTPMREAVMINIATGKLATAPQEIAMVSSIGSCIQ
jgi:hypothetical protein